MFQHQLGLLLFLATSSGSGLPALASASAASKGWPADLDWAPLTARLSADASLVDAGFADFQRECIPEYADKPPSARTNHALVDQPSGLCMAHLFCAYERCYPRPDADGHAGTMFSQRLADVDPAATIFGSWDDLSPEVRGWLEDPDNPALDLPSKVLFPAVASDVVAAVEFAGQNGLEVSVKNSGHSYAGASTKQDTLHINMNRFRQYAPKGIVDCNDDDDGEDPVCALATARGKPGYIRVGGGENWDKTFRAVDQVNEAEGNKYHVLGGAAGTVSPMGWTFQGGLGGTAGGRSRGFGVDQILQVEMVLPNGWHVKFGPAEWADATSDGFVAPKTTSVAGVCRSNPDEADEALWEWGDCPDGTGVDFDDLWYAVAGGGGGTWGVVTSMYLQLHDYATPYFYGYLALPGTCGVISPHFLPIWNTFRSLYLFKPSLVNVTQADSDACGSSDPPMLACFGEGIFQNMLNAWKSYLAIHQDELPDGVTVDDVLACSGEIDTLWHQQFTYLEGPYIGKVQDSPPPSFASGIGEEPLNVLIPKEYIENNFEEYLQSFGSTNQPIYYAFGPGTAAANDQANSLSAAHRGAGAKVILGSPDVFYAQYFPKFYDLSDKSNFPGFLGSNHVTNEMMGPQKDDWTKACPSEWTQQERDEKCVSVQEAIYGTKTLQRLETIKEALDPNYIFDCHGCIGNNRVKDTPGTPSPPAETTPSPTVSVAEAPTKTTPKPTVSVVETPAATTPNPTVTSASSNFSTGWAMSLNILFLLGKLFEF